MGSISLKSNAVPRCIPSRRLPLAYEQLVKGKIQDLLQRGIIERCSTPSSWTNPILAVPKKDKLDIRLCLDLRYVNQFIEDQLCVLPNLNELAVFAEGAVVFSIIDLPDAFHLVELEERVRDLTTFAVLGVLYRYIRLCFGLKNAPAIFMKVIRFVLDGCEGVLPYMDDLLIVGKNTKDHDDKLSKVLKRLDEFNIPVNAQKCKLRLREVDFIGHVFNEEGVKPSPKKIEALRNCTAPSSKSEVNSFLGMLSYVAHRWLPDLAELTYPLRKLTHKDIHFKWELEQQTAFDTIIARLEQLVTLGYVSLTEEFELHADASPYGCGAVLAQRNSRGEIRPIAFASKCFSHEDRALSQTEREALALVWAIEYFDYFLRGRIFKLFTDHKPLEIIFGIRKQTSSLTSARILRWLLRIQEYTFEIKYIPGRRMIADCFSRQINREEMTQRCTKDEVECINLLIEDSVGAITKLKIQEASVKDELFARIKKCLVKGVWEVDLTKYKGMQAELTILGDIILRGNRVLLPNALVPTALKIAHEGHLGISLMKRRIRSRYYWSGLDKDIEDHVNNCDQCRLVAKPLPAEPLSRSELPDFAWQKLAIDFMGPTPSGEKILVVVDYYSRYFEVKYLHKTDAVRVIEQLEEIFGRLDWPEEITADNGPPFNSVQFETFCETHGIRLRHSLPYQPRMNGEVEIQNKALAKVITISVNSGKNWKSEVLKFLENHRMTEHTVTGRAPLELMINRNRKLRGKLQTPQDLKITNADALEIEMRRKDWVQKNKGKLYADKRFGYKENAIATGDYVMKKIVNRRWKWTAKNDPQKYKVVGKSGAAVTLEDASGECT